MSLFICKTKIADTFFAGIYHFWKFDMYRSTIVEIMGPWTWYFGSLDTVHSNLITQRERAVNLLIYFLKGTINSSAWWKFQVFWPMDHKMTNLFAKFNGKNILLTVFAKFTEYQSKVLTEMPNFG